MLRVTNRQFSLITAIIGFLSLSAGVLIEIEFVRYPLLTVSFASFLFSVLHLLPKASLGPLTSTAAKSLDAVVFLLITLTAILGHLERGGVFDFYYVFAVGTSGVLSYRLSRRPIRPSMGVVQIVLFALVLRSVLWFSYPVYGADRFHFAAFGWIINTGELVPETITYYRDFPIAHIFASTFGIVTEVPLKVGYFSLGISQACSLIVVYCFAKKISDSTHTALLGTLFVAVSGFHIKSGGEPFAQALLTAIMPVILFLMFFGEKFSKRNTALILGLIVILTLTQNIAPLILTGIGGLTWFSGALAAKAKTHIDSAQLYADTTFVVMVGGIAGFLWYDRVGYLSYQVLRVFRIVLLLDGNGQGSIENTGASGVPTVVLFGQELPGVLMWAAPLLCAALLVGLASYFSLRDFLTKRDHRLPIQYMLFGLLTFTGLAAVFAAGSRDARRAVPIILIILSPLAGMALNRVRERRGQIGFVLVAVLIMMVAFSGVLSPAVAKPELSEHSYQKTLSSNQLKAIEWTKSHTTSAQSGPYVSGYDHISQASKGEQPVVTIRQGFSESDPSTIDQFEKNGSRKTVIYLDYYDVAFDLSEPASNRVYDSGDSSVYNGNSS
ncbi:hypothetical protein [Haloferax sp. Atlit-4N]|uniref:hypothetical protein n=1 Tax=Haloferax sp. Atlit-4N TaxID=2077206 RepID=UPI0011C03FBF|nr:hypothetical protein [Haloferax sp. Atlit-4N]